MEFSSNFIAILGVVALLLLYNQWRAKKYSSKGRSLPPQVPGALPIIGHLHQLGARKPFARILGDIADKNGPIFSIMMGMRRTVVISNQHIMKEFYTTKDKFLSSRPLSSQSKYLAYNHASFGFTPYTSYWRDVRKLTIVEVLTPQRLKLLQDVLRTSEVSHVVMALFKQFKENKDKPIKVDMSELFEHLVLNIITRTVAGKRYFEGDNNGHDEKGRPIGKVMRDFMYFAGAFVPSDMFPFLGWTEFLGPVKSMKKILKEMDSIIEAWVREHELKRLNGEVETNHDFIDVLLTAMKDDAIYGNSRETVIKATILTLIVGGSDTTILTMTWMLANLLNNRRELQLAQEEIDQKIGRDRPVEESDVENLVYLKAIMKETLRLYPAGPLAFPREAMEDCTLFGYHIPKGTRLLTNLWKLHHDGNVWPNPDEFKPDRFLTTHADVDVLGQNFELVPFGSGRRSCPGLNFAMQVIQLGMARLLQGFNFTTPNNEPVDMTESLTLTLAKETPLEVIVTPRLAPEFYQY
ncbi:cytochrome P450 CYP82D47-like [Manihot esculenta]|uniref:Uncharacterized protein n=1 Tax=Manihot esculenta TaxID=3983 RepID=A0ACB7GNN9_MANES|nr:cytochrome P450 CYP82D47-like [Manihot esculenta]KAG8641972.1 hypothetical protein MANES_12G049250v8 [Manihot esculenta]